MRLLELRAVQGQYHVVAVLSFRSGSARLVWHEPVFSCASLHHAGDISLHMVLRRQNMPRRSTRGRKDDSHAAVSEAAPLDPRRDTELRGVQSAVEL